MFEIPQSDHKEREMTGETAAARQMTQARPAKRVGFYNQQFRTTSQLKNMNTAVQHLKEATALLRKGRTEVSTQFNNLSDWHERRFDRSGELSDLNKAIQYQQLAISLIPEGHSDIPDWLDSLAGSFLIQFQRSGDLGDLALVIEYRKHAISLTPEGHPDMPARLINLGDAFRSLFERSGDPSDIDGAINHQQQAISIAPEEHPDMPLWHSLLGLSLQNRFERSGSLADIDNAIKHQRIGTSLTPEDDPEMAFQFNNLGLSLWTRFYRLGDLTDVDKAIEYQQRAISLAPEGHPSIPTWINNLGNSFQTRFQTLGDLADVEKAIEQKRRTIFLAPEGHSEIPNWLNTLGISLHARFQRLGNRADLDEAIELQQRAVTVAPEGHVGMPIWLSSLGSSLHDLFGRSRDLADLDKAIKTQQRAILLTPKGHAYMVIWLQNLGCLFESRFELLGINDDLDQSITSFKKAALSLTGSPRMRFEAALWWAHTCDNHSVGSMLDAYGQAMIIFPEIAWLGITVKDRYNNIVDMGDICAEAVAAAISMKDYRSALEWFEEGRSIVWKQMLQLRAPVDELSAINSALAAQLKQVANDLDRSGSRGTSEAVNTLSDENSFEQATQQHHHLAEKWEELVAQARDHPGFENFLRPKKASELICSAHSCNVVMINVHKDRCDALIVRQTGSDILHVPLVNFSLQKATDISNKWEHVGRSRGSPERAFIKPTPKGNEYLGEALATLWQEVVYPVLGSLGYDSIPANSLPHITWCTTGPLAFLPLHAAGNYGTGSIIYDYVISSYTPNLTTLLSPTQPPNAFTGILAIGQKSTPGLPLLPGTDDELACIRGQFMGHNAMQLNGDMATPTAVLAGMEEHSWVHLACHATQNTKTPTKSAFHLHNGTLELATITQKQLKYADLAFLSACETAMGDEKLPDEAVHLAAGMLMAGYRTVIATMWPIGDNDAPLFADKVYEHLLAGKSPDARRASVAVHKATECLRAKVGVKEFTKWAPYIHIGL